MSSRQPEVNKNKILDWIKGSFPNKEDDVTKFPNILWSIQIGGGGLIVYTMDTFPDRVIIQADISFSDEQQDLLNKKWDVQKLSKLQLQIISSLTNFNVRHSILSNKNKEITGFRIFLFLIDNLNKETLLNSIFRIVDVLNVTLNQLSAVIGIELQQLKQQQKESSFNPLAM